MSVLLPSFQVPGRQVCQCHVITYCDQECQVADLSSHKDNCVPVMISEVGEES